MLNSHMFSNIGEILKSGVNYQCLQCEVVNNALIEIDEFEFDSSTYERGMGPQVIYNAETILECSDCGKENILEVTLCEYPSEAYNSHDIKVNGKEI